METHFGLHTLDGEWFDLLPRHHALASWLSGRKVLELGCGRGVGTALLHRAGVGTLTAADHRAALIQDAQARYDDLDGVFEVVRYDALPYEDGQFDVVLWLDDTLSLSEGGALDEARRVLAPQGVLVVALSVTDGYGLSRLLPRSEAVSGASGEATFSKVIKRLLESFKVLRSLSQVPLLGYVFEPQPRGAVEASLGGQQTMEFAGVVGASEPPRDLPSEPLRLANQPTARAVGEIVLCADHEMADLDELLSRPVRMLMAHDAVISRLGRLVNGLYQQVDDHVQRHLLIEEQVDERSKLIDDLEEEVRGQRELARDQAGQLEGLKGQLTQISRMPDLTADFARAQADLAGKQQEILELTADFNRRVQELTWSLQERDQYIDHLAVVVRDWERHGAELREQLDARELALANIGRVLQKRESALETLRARLSEEGRALRAEEGDVAEDGVEVESDSVEASAAPESEAPTEPVTSEREEALEAELGALRASFQGLRDRRDDARVALNDAQRALRDLQRELGERRAYNDKLEARLDVQETQARQFAEGVAQVFEQRNDLQIALEKAEEKIKSLEQKTEKTQESSVNLERELERRAEQLLKLKRELMGKNVEISGLERENISLLQAKSKVDKVLASEKEASDAQAAQQRQKLAELEAALSEAQGELAAARAEVASLRREAAAAQETLVEAPSEAVAPEVEVEADGEQAPQGGEGEAPTEEAGEAPREDVVESDEPAPEAEESVSATSPSQRDERDDGDFEIPEMPVPYRQDGRPSVEEMVADGMRPVNQNFWRSGESVYVGTSRYWAQATIKGDRVRLQGANARATTIKFERVHDILMERFKVSRRWARQFMSIFAELR